MTWFRIRIGWLLVIGGVLVGCVAALVVLAQGFDWLQHGVWRDLTARNLFANTDLTVEWVGAQKLIDWALALPMALVIFFAGLAGVSFGLWLAVD